MASLGLGFLILGPWLLLLGIFLLPLLFLYLLLRWMRGRRPRAEVKARRPAFRGFSLSSSQSPKKQLLLSLGRELERGTPVELEKGQVLDHLAVLGEGETLTERIIAYLLKVASSLLILDPCGSVRVPLRLRWKIKVLRPSARLQVRFGLRRKILLDLSRLDPPFQIAVAEQALRAHWTLGKGSLHATVISEPSRIDEAVRRALPDGRVEVALAKLRASGHALVLLEGKPSHRSLDLISGCGTLIAFRTDDPIDPRLVCAAFGFHLLSPQGAEIVSSLVSLEPGHALVRTRSRIRPFKLRVEPWKG